MCGAPASGLRRWWCWGLWTDGERHLYLSRLRQRIQAWIPWNAWKNPRNQHKTFEKHSDMVSLSVFRPVSLCGSSWQQSLCCLVLRRIDLSQEIIILITNRHVSGIKKINQPIKINWFYLCFENALWIIHPSNHFPNLSNSFWGHRNVVVYPNRCRTKATYILDGVPKIYLMWEAGFRLYDLWHACHRWRTQNESVVDYNIHNTFWI